MPEMQLRSEPGGGDVSTVRECGGSIETRVLTLDRSEPSGPASLVRGSFSDADALALAYGEAQYSPDPSTQNGAVVTGFGGVLGHGCNGFQSGTPAEWGDPDWRNRDLKYALVTHAEVSASVDALRSRQPLEDATLAVIWYACTDCAKVIVASGIKRVVGHANHRRFASSVNPRWDDSIVRALEMLERSGVACEWYEGLIDAPAVRIGGQMYDPSK